MKPSYPRTSIFIVLIILVASYIHVSGQAQSKYLHVFKINNTDELQEFFKYSPDFIPFISAHRGGADIGFPENCIATYENTLLYTHAMLEIDTRITKDGNIVLMHDPTIDRTTTGSGKVSDMTLEELKEVYLKDVEGNITPYKIPTFDEVLEWADGKTILVLDRKGTPFEILAAKAKEHNALHRVVFMAYNPEEVKGFHQTEPEAVMEVFAKDKTALQRLIDTGVPSNNMVPFIKHGWPDDEEIYKLINNNGMMNIIGTSRLIDNAFKAGNKKVYEELIEKGCNIIEADLAVDAGLRIKRLRPEKSSKDKFFGKILY